MSPIHFRLISAVLNARRIPGGGAGARVSPQDVECGLKYVNNDACYPAIMVIGQLVNTFLTGGPTRTCRGGDHPDRRHVPGDQLCRHAAQGPAGRRVPPGAGRRPQRTRGSRRIPGSRSRRRSRTAAIQALVLGDLLQNVLLRVRPYERDRGQRRRRSTGAGTPSAGSSSPSGGHSPTLRRRIGYSWLIDSIVSRVRRAAAAGRPPQAAGRDRRRDPRQVPPRRQQRRRRGDRGRGLRGRRCPACWSSSCSRIYTGDWKLGQPRHRQEGAARQAGRALAGRALPGPADAALARTGGKFTVAGGHRHHGQRARRTSSSLGTQAGEGWLLTAEMMELIEHGTPNIICAQPFACLPNHVIGQGHVQGAAPPVPAGQHRRRSTTTPGPARSTSSTGSS